MEFSDSVKDSAIYGAAGSAIGLGIAGYLDQKYFTKIAAEQTQLLNDVLPTISQFDTLEKLQNDSFYERFGQRIRGLKIHAHDTGMPDDQFNVIRDRIDLEEKRRGAMLAIRDHSLYGVSQGVVEAFAFRKGISAQEISATLFNDSFQPKPFNWEPLTQGKLLSGMMVYKHGATESGFLRDGVRESIPGWMTYVRGKDYGLPTYETHANSLSKDFWVKDAHSLGSSTKGKIANYGGIGLALGAVGIITAQAKHLIKAYDNAKDTKS